MNLYNSEEAANVSRRHPETIRDACRAGELHGVQRKKGGPWLIAEPCLAAWVFRQKCEHQAAKSNVTRIDRRAS
ncbi:MAG: DNA-binding protein [Herbiconiux sp.]|uniref:helix-turn-helix domain-containing protein n=1 Tax=Herbiconiux sp. TaxID=1871186 RepID=UPI00120AFA9B|nr:helix-turn-helix domain-containing protein [Herbiconiux sp.]TAJ46334.1 MAG: DNA-binding protein [Herbiconiux sp.]